MELKKGIDFIGNCVVFFCHDGLGNFVMAKRSANSRDENGRWDIGGGAVELHQTVDFTIRDEILNEYKTEVLYYEFLGFRDVHREHEGRMTHWIALDFKVLVKHELVAIGEPHTFDEIGWFRLENLPNPVHSQFPDFLKRYQEKLERI